MSQKNFFFVSDVETVTGVKRIRLQQWLKAEYLTPSIEKASGHGTRNVFSLNDLFSIELFKRLVELGTSREWASWIVNNTVGELFNETGDKRPYLWFSGAFSLAESRAAGCAYNLYEINSGMREAFGKNKHEFFSIIDLSQLMYDILDKLNELES